MVLPIPASAAALRRAAESLVQSLFYAGWKAREDTLRASLDAAARLQGREAILAHTLGAVSAYAGGDFLV